MSPRVVDVATSMSTTTGVGRGARRDAGGPAVVQLRGVEPAKGLQLATDARQQAAEAGESAGARSPASIPSPRRRYLRPPLANWRGGP